MAVVYLFSAMLQMKNTRRRTSASYNRKTQTIPVKHREAITWCYHESIPHAVSKYKWDTKGGHEVCIVSVGGNALRNIITFVVTK